MKEMEINKRGRGQIKEVREVVVRKKHRGYKPLKTSMLVIQRTANILSAFKILFIYNKCISNRTKSHRSV